MKIKFNTDDNIPFKFIKTSICIKYKNGSIRKN